jgi:hypothetical protein
MCVTSFGAPLDVRADGKASARKECRQRGNATPRWEGEILRLPEQQDIGDEHHHERDHDRDQNALVH